MVNRNIVEKFPYIQIWEFMVTRMGWAKCEGMGQTEWEDYFTTQVKALVDLIYVQIRELTENDMPNIPVSDLQPLSFDEAIAEGEYMRECHECQKRKEEAKKHKKQNPYNQGLEKAAKLADKVYGKGNVLSNTIRGDKKKANLIEDIYSNRWKYLSNSKKYPNYRLRLKCTEKDKYEYLDEQFNYYQKKYYAAKEKHKDDVVDISYLENFYLRKGLERKQFLEKVKIPYIQRFLPTIQDKRFICFGGSISTINKLSNTNKIFSKIMPSKSIQMTTK